MQPGARRQHPQPRKAAQSFQGLQRLTSSRRGEALCRRGLERLRPARRPKAHAPSLPTRRMCLLFPRRKRDGKEGAQPGIVPDCQSHDEVHERRHGTTCSRPRCWQSPTTHRHQGAGSQRRPEGSPSGSTSPQPGRRRTRCSRKQPRPCASGESVAMLVSRLHLVRRRKPTGLRALSKVADYTALHACTS